MFFFFQAEDGIRDLVRSRGLGDVYKRQVGKAYNVQFIPQLVLVDKSGIIKKVIIGLMSEEDLEKEIENLIK